MVRIESTYEGDLHTSCVHEPSGAELGTDAPKDNHGLGASFSPTDLVATGVGSCMLTVMGIVARRHEWSLEGATATVDKHMVAEPARRIGRLDVRFDLPAGFEPKARALLERAAMTCPVKQSLHPDIEIDVRFDWR